MKFCSVWVAQRPPEYPFVEFDDHKDPLNAIHTLDENIITPDDVRNMWHIAFSTLALLRFEESVLGAAQNFPLFVNVLCFRKHGK
ncbi:uncharacterized protein LOC115970056 [Quercus lobata]|uniref:uncharacterized protein LOC115970056 n=1 Tax=Quercus lobata TaxID=97700 RepID=UPI0012483A50|nr:uncharacterized protein LOC115970056 [Quercus lobata]